MDVGIITLSFCVICSVCSTIHALLVSLKKQRQGIIEEKAFFPTGKAGGDVSK